jgi:hypothetical protein
MNNFFNVLISVLTDKPPAGAYSVHDYEAPSSWPVKGTAKLRKNRGNLMKKIAQTSENSEIHGLIAIIYRKHPAANSMRRRTHTRRVLGRKHKRPPDPAAGRIVLQDRNAARRRNQTGSSTARHDRINAYIGGVGSIQGIGTRRRGRRHQQTDGLGAIRGGAHYG